MVNSQSHMMHKSKYYKLKTNTIECYIDNL